VTGQVSLSGARPKRMHDHLCC